MNFWVILFSIIILFVSFGFGMLVGHMLTKKDYDNEKNYEENYWNEYEFFTKDE